MLPLVVIAIVVLVALASFMAAAAWKLLRADRERSAARVAALDELARQHDENDPADVVRPKRRMSDRDHDAALEDEWDFEFRPAPAPAAALSEPVVRRPAPRVEPRPEPPLLAMADGMFGSAAEPPRRRGNQLWTAAATAVVVLALGTGMVYAVRHADSIAGLGRRITASRPSPRTVPLELVSLRHTEDAEGAFTVTGFVQNPDAGSAATAVVAVVYLFDQNGEYFATGRAPLEVKSLGPGDESPFVVTIPKAAGVSRYRIGFRTDDGAVVAHVDRRGSTRQSAPGDVTNGVNRHPDPPSTPRRVEG